MVTWQKRNSVPDPIGWAGMIGGVSNGVLIAGGGANFPESPPWAGGKKAWSKDLFVLSSPEKTWRRLSTPFTQPLGYAVCASNGRQVIIAGGESPLESGSGTRCRNEVLKLEWADLDVKISSFPSLPVPVTNASGALLENDLYVVGGICSPTANNAENHVFRLNVSDPDRRGWKSMECIPGPGRMLGVVATFNGSLYLFGGVSLSEDEHGKIVRTPLLESYRFTPKGGWQRLADLPVPVTAAPSPAPIRDGKIILLGGDDGSQMKNPPEQHRGFSDQLLIYDIHEDRFHKGGSFPALHVTAPLVPWKQSWFLISGEIRPGVRSPEVWECSMSPTKSEE
ncbi:MAG TPA: hypothetical protein VNQ76_20420 [Planctomicrobium sp.]|nr:hypothetical protein [Planctomicrobium sp.]